MNLENVIKEAQELLCNNPEWKNRYKGYADNLLANIDVIKSNRSSRFNEFKPLYFYISTTNAKNAKTKLILDVRYRGQSVATLKANNNSITISTQQQDNNNLRDFNCDIKLKDIPWQETEASEFRKFFKNRANSRNDKKNKKNEEHNVESLLLTEFSKRNSHNKQITGIQPVKICGNRFGMPTPIKASNHKAIDYSKQNGGGIDIFARTGKGHATYLTVIEVKDENNYKEPPLDALIQAIQYAVFIRELLRSDCGAIWYKIFGFTGTVPKKLKIRVAFAMPDDNADKAFAKKSYPIGEDKIECHYIYFKYDGKQLSDFQTSL
jgi:hypothetical protein